jgi:hypothetical protein
MTPISCGAGFFLQQFGGEIRDTSAQPQKKKTGTGRREVRISLRDNTNVLALSKAAVPYVRTYTITEAISEAAKIGFIRRAGSPPALIRMNGGGQIPASGK